MLQLPVAQIAYFVSDIHDAAARMAAAFGAGPFFVSERIELSRGEHRGKDCPFVHSSAYGQWGAVMVELVQQDSPGPSPFRDLYAEGEEGLHHTAIIVDSLPEAIAHHERNGMPLATYATTLSGVDFVFMDAIAQLGHMIELYEGSPGLRGFYDMVRQASQGWDGSDPVRRP